MNIPASDVPDVIEHPQLCDYLDVMSRAVFQAGLSWASIGRHWDAYRAAFDGFDPAKVALYTEGDVDRLMRAEGVLHSSRKIRATIDNACAIVELDRKYAPFDNLRMMVLQRIFIPSPTTPRSHSTSKNASSSWAT